MRRLYLSEVDKKIAGVCGGMGEMMEVDPTIIRLMEVVLGLVTGILPFGVGYLIAWWLIPKRRHETSNVRQGP